MTPQEFCYGLQGLFELGNPTHLSPEQTECIKKHLRMVFHHYIDKTYPESQQSTLSEIHNNNDPYTDVRC